MGRAGAVGDAAGRDRAVERVIIVAVLGGVVLLFASLDWWKLPLERTTFLMISWWAFGSAWLVGRHHLIGYSHRSGFDPETGDHGPPETTKVPAPAPRLLAAALAVGGIAFGLAATATPIGDVLAVPARGGIALWEAAKVMYKLGFTALIFLALLFLLGQAVVRRDVGQFASSPSSSASWSGPRC